jgi:hypothetical protein
MVDPLSKLLNSIESIELKSNDHIIDLKNNIENMKSILLKLNVK